MSLAVLNTRAQLGIEAPDVRVEVHIANGLPAFTVVGLPETAVREARDRVRSAIQNSGFEFPARRVTVNLAPADLPKEGGRYDLPIALGILAASAQIDITTLKNHACFGELALDGSCRQISDLLPALIFSQRAGQSVIIPAPNRIDAAMLGALTAGLATSLAQVCHSLNGGDPLPRVVAQSAPRETGFELDLSEVNGQHRAKRALEIAAAGEHHLLMTGPPGAGKSMLAQRLTTILPPLTDDEAMTCASIRSICSEKRVAEVWHRRPFQSPHHTVSAAALAGGGSNPRPGEISLAHDGVLFLDELGEFSRNALEVLREPLETGEIHISRARRNAVFPARFQLVAAMNPCPGGCASIRDCNCAPERLRRYRYKLSAPLLDRIDIQIELARPSRSELADNRSAQGPGSLEVRRRVIAARQRQRQRQGCTNARLDTRQLTQICRLESAAESLLFDAIDKLDLSARRYHKLLRLGRSIADLAGVDGITQTHIAEAISLRQQAPGR